LRETKKRKERWGKEKLTKNLCSLPTVRVFGSGGSGSESDGVESDDEGDDIAEGEKAKEGKGRRRGRKVSFELS